MMMQKGSQQQKDLLNSIFTSSVQKISNQLYKNDLVKQEQLKFLWTAKNRFPNFIYTQPTIKFK